MITIIILFTVALLGGILARYRLAPKSIKTALQRYVYYFAAPSAIIYSLGVHDPSGSSRYIKFLIINFLCYLVLFMITFFFLERQKVERRIAGVVAFASNAPNTVFLGFPLVLALFGQEAFVYAALLGSLCDAFLNAVRLLKLHSYKSSMMSSRKHSKLQLLSIVKSIAINPFMIALVIGGALSVFQVPIAEELKWPGLSASYAAMFALGLSVGNLKIKKDDHGEIAIISALKLVALPVLVFIPSYFLLDVTARNAGVFVAALPVAVFSLTVANTLKLDEDLAASAILVTTVLSTLSLTAWFIILKIILV